MAGSKERKERAAKEGGKKEQKERRKWRNQRHHPTLDSPGAPLATPFLLPLAHSSSCYSTRPLKALFVPPPRPPPSTALHLSLFPLYVSHSFDLVSRTSSLFTSRHAPTSCVPPNGVTYFAAIATNVHVVAKLLLTFCQN